MNPSEHVYYRQVIQDIALIVSLQKRDAHEADLDTPAAKVQRYLLTYPQILFGGDESYGTPAKELMGVMTSFNSALSAAASAVSVALGFFTKSTTSELDSISVLPPEIMLNIFKNFSLKEIARLRSVNRAFRDLGKYVMVKKINEANINLYDAGFRSKDEVLSFLTSLGLDNSQLITHLNLEGLPVDDDFLKELFTLTPNLQSLNIFGSRDVSNKGLEHISLFTQLTSLNLGCCFRLAEGGLEALASLKGLKNLNLSHCTGLTDDDLTCLALFEQLECLDLEYCPQFSARGIAHLAHVKQLKKLSLSDCRYIDDDCLTVLALLTELKELNLFGCPNITNDGLAQLVSLTKLESLDLTYCHQLTDDGLAHLVFLINLKSLRLSGCGLITDAGMLYLVKLTHLKKLSLFCCYRLTDESLSLLALLIQLEHLELYGCHLISHTARQHLRDQIPNLVIHPF